MGVKPTLIPFQGTGPAMNALVGGQVDYMTDQIVNAVPQVVGGTIKAYAIGTPERNPSLPNVPTSKEAGMPDFQASAWNALFAPKGTPEPVIAKLNEALRAAVAGETLQKRLAELAALQAQVDVQFKRGSEQLKALKAEYQQKRDDGQEEAALSGLDGQIKLLEKCSLLYTVFP